jgi:hypothetical protein
LSFPSRIPEPLKFLHHLENQPILSEPHAKKVWMHHSCRGTMLGCKNFTEGQGASIAQWTGNLKICGSNPSQDNLIFISNNEPTSALHFIVSSLSSLNYRPTASRQITNYVIRLVWSWYHDTSHETQGCATQKKLLWYP